MDLIPVVSSAEKTEVKGVHLTSPYGEGNPAELSSLTLCVKTSAVTRPSLQRNGITQQTEELVEALAPRL